MTPVIERFDGEYAFLSNFYPSPIVLPRWHPADGMTAPTVEHAFQSAKTEDVAQARLIVSSGSPATAKKLGRSVSIRPGWDGVRVSVMSALLRLKFAPESELAELLLATDEADLVEGNNWGDCFWGRVDGQGYNWLGFLLKLVRAELRIARSATTRS